MLNEGSRREEGSKAALQTRSIKMATSFLRRDLIRHLVSTWLVCAPRWSSVAPGKGERI
jgi:hypothetical protein